MSNLAVDVGLLRRRFPQEAIKHRAGGGGRQLAYLEGHTVIIRLNEACPSWDLEIIREWQEGDLLKAHVRLTIPGLGSREHIGVQKVTPGSGEDLHKGVITDALKKAATLFGVGIELYGPDYEDSLQQVGRMQPSKRESKQPTAKGEDERIHLEKAIRSYWAHRASHGEPEFNSPNRQYNSIRSVHKQLPASASPQSAVRQWFDSSPLQDLHLYRRHLKTKCEGI